MRPNEISPADIANAMKMNVGELLRFAHNIEAFYKPPRKAWIGDIVPSMPSIRHRRGSSGSCTAGFNSSCWLIPVPMAGLFVGPASPARTDTSANGTIGFVMPLIAIHR